MQSGLQKPGSVLAYPPDDNAHQLDRQIVRTSWGLGVPHADTALDPRGRQSDTDSFSHAPVLFHAPLDMAVVERVSPHLEIVYAPKVKTLPEGTEGG